MPNFGDFIENEGENEENQSGAEQPEQPNNEQQGLAPPPEGWGALGGDGVGQDAPANMPWWEQPINTAPTSIMPPGFDPETMYDVPADWDYKTAQFGIHGEALPNGAEGWTAAGDPWYGTNNAWTEWRAKVKNGNGKIRTIVTEESSLIARAEYREALAKKAEFHEKGEWWNAFKAGLSATGSLVAAATNTTKEDKAALKEFEAEFDRENLGPYDNMDTEGKVDHAARAEDLTVEAAWLRSKAEEIGVQEEAKMSGSARVSDFIINGLGSGLNLGAEFVEREYVSRMVALSEIGDDSKLWDMTPDDKQGENLDKTGDVLAGGLNLIQGKEWDTDNPILKENFSNGAKVFIKTVEAIVPVFNTWNIVRAVVAPGSAKDKWAYMNERARAGRVLYSSLVEETITQEYLNRLKDKEHPYLLQIELQKPGAEMIGQLLADPLNLLDFWGKGGKTVGKIRDMEQYLLSPADEVADIAKILEKGDEAVDMLEFADKTTELMKRTGNLLDNMDPVTNLGGKQWHKKIRKWYNQQLLKTNMFGWTVSAKRTHLTRVTRDMFRNIVMAVGDDPGDVAKVIDNIVHLTSGDQKKVATALTNLGTGGVPLDMILSEGGARFANVIGAMVKNEDGVLDATRFLDKIQSFENGDELLKYFSNKVDDVASGMFPNLEKQKEIGRKIAQSEELTAKEMMSGVEQLSIADNVFLTVDKIKQNKIVSAVNSFYANVYMGMSLGYAVRNLLTNELHLFVDLGVGKYIESLQTHILHGGFDNYLQRLTKDAAGEMAEGGFGIAGEVGQKGLLGGAKGRMPGLVVGEAAEKWSSKRIYAVAYKEVVDSMMPKIVQRFQSILTDSDVLSKQEFRILDKMIKNSYGDIDKAVNAFVAEKATGYIDLFAKGEWLPDEVMGHLDGLWLGDDVRRIITESGETAEMVQAKLRGMFNEVRKEARKVTETITYPPAGTGEDAGEFMSSYNEIIRQSSDLIKHENLKAANNMAMMANRGAHESWNFVLTEIIKLGDKYPDVDIRGIIGNDEFLDSIIYGDYFGAAETRYAEMITGPYNKIIDRVNNGNLSPARAWGMIPEMPGSAPADLTAEGFGDFLFGTVFPVEARRYWQPVRDQHAVTCSEAINRVIEAGLPVDEKIQNWIADAVRATKEAEAWDTGIIRDLSYLENGVASGNLRLVGKAEEGFANYNNVIRLGVLNEAYKPGAPTNEFLNRINKYAGTNYKYLDVVPFDVAEAALKNKYGAGFKPYVPGLVPDGVPPVAVEIPEALTDVLTAAKNVSPDTKLAEMDQRVREVYQFWADWLKQEIGDVQGVGKGTRGGQMVFTDEGKTVERLSTSYGDWYGTLASPYYKGERGIEAVQSALEAISRGEDGGQRLVERLKEVIQTKLDQTPEDYLATIKEMIQAKGIEPSDAPDGWIEHMDRMGLTDLGDDFFTDATRIAAPIGAEPTSMARAYFEQLPHIAQLERELMLGVKNNFGRTLRTVGNDITDEALEQFRKLASKEELGMRVVANEVATERRNFALLNYQSTRNINALTGLIYPYHFWYGGTYPNWARRVAQNPAILAHYAKYKEAMAMSHVNAPDWWKNNMNLNELLGFGNANNPIMINLEATMNPLNGMLGVDFEDKNKRINWWTTTIDNLNRAGPSIHPMISMATAYALHLQGQEDAAARWAGRFIPFSNVTKAIGSVTGIDWLMKEWDPWVNLFSGGIDPYERRRVGRQITDMWVNKELTAEQAYDTAWMQSGEGWELARKGAIGERAWGVITSFFGGVGFKQRNPADMATDEMYEEIGRLMEMRELKTPEQFSEEFRAISDKYPFMDMVLISTKAGDARDPAMAYHVMSLLPPGQSSEYYEHVGLSGDLVEKFYDSKGDMSDWAQSDRDRFMGSILDLNMVLSIPDGTTQTEWDEAKGKYRQLMSMMADNYGADIEDRIDAYYQLINADDEEGADQFLAIYPEVEEALDWKKGMMLQDKTGLLATYYGGMGKIQGYYMGLMYDQAKEIYGEDIVEVNTEFFQLERLGNEFLMDNPQLVGYWDYRRDAKEQMDAEAASLFGEEILFIADAYGSLKDEEKKAYRQENSQLYQFWDWREIMYTAMDEQAAAAFGENIRQVNEQYFDVVDVAKDAFKAEHPELEQYWAFKDQNEEMINNKIIEAAYLLPEGKPAEIREDYDPEAAGVGAQNLAEFIETNQDPLSELEMEDWERILKPETIDSISRMVTDGENILSSREKDIQYAAEDLTEDFGFEVTKDQIIQYLGVLIREQMSQEEVIDLQN